MNAQIELIIFDCDGVLIDSELISARSLISALEDRGVQVNLDYVAEHFLGRSYPVVLAQIRGEFGVELDDTFEEEYRKRLLERFRSELRAMPGIRTLLSSLEIPYCVATSSSPLRVRASLEIVGLTDLMEDRVFTASEVARGKPAPDLFLHAAARMGVTPDRCLVIEDSRNGIRAARAAGMRVWWFHGGSHITEADYARQDALGADMGFGDFGAFSRLQTGLQTGG